MISVLDTSAFSAAMRNEPEMVGFLRSLKPGQVAVVPPVVAEIEYGIQRLTPGNRQSLLARRQERLLSTIRLLDWIPEASVRFGAIKSSLEHSGQIILDFDIAIAAIAVAHGAQLITANLAHFRRIEDLTCRHWTR